jgi:hypothetical protein
MSEASPFSGYEIKYKCGEGGWGIWDMERERWHSMALYTTTLDAIEALDLLNKGETTMESKQELANEVTKGPKVGDKVHDNASGYNATIIATRDVRLYTIQVNLYGSRFDLTREADQFKPIVELSQEEAWTELPISVMRLLKTYQIRLDIPIYASDQRAIRHECYVLLGTSHVKITPEVKVRVRSVIADVADVLHIGLG